MLIEGATFEDIVEAINERRKARITLHAVQNHFRSSLSLQQERVKHQLEAAQALKQAMGDPESGQQELADAILLTGLMRINRRGGEFTAQDAVYEKFKRDNLDLKKDQVRMQRQKLQLDKRLAQTRLKVEHTKHEVIKAKLREMEQLIESHRGGKNLGPEALEKIQEIYGLVSKPSVPKGVENAEA
jgi:cysteinyl-tRNA synthetase